MATPEINEPTPVKTEADANLPATDHPEAETPAAPPVPLTPEEKEEQDEKKRRLLLLLLLLLLVCLCCVCGLLGRYLIKKEPLPNIIIPTQVSVCTRPAYKFSINNVDGPVSVALSPDGNRIYAAETGGSRLVKVFDRDGNFVTSFAPPGTDKANREPKYMAIDKQGRIFLVDRTSQAIDIYDPNGNLIDAIIGQQMTLTKYIAQQSGGSVPRGLIITHYEGINKNLTYTSDLGLKTIHLTIPEENYPFSPLGLRFDADGNLIYTDTTTDAHSVRVIPAAALEGDLSAFAPVIATFGSEGPGNEQFQFPQTVVKDGRGNFYISDGNNARVSVWTPERAYKTFFGFGQTQGALNLPRGMWMARGDCLVVADAVGSTLRVYNVSGDEPQFAFDIGEFGLEEGKFNYPIDVYIDGTGRLYIADRDNNRIQVWSY